jgi:N-acetylglucosamine kinase-like BadF-type ATPase
MLYLGIDAGATATKWSIHDGTKTVTSGKSAAMDGHIYRAESAKRMHEVLLDIASQCDGAHVTSIYAGLTGLAESPEDRAKIESIFKGYFPNAVCTLVLDIELAYRAYFKPGAGILLYAGTGSIAMHITQAGELVRAGGWGYLLGDEGAGYWIGREAMRHIALQLELKIRDPFTDLICKKLGISNWGDIRSIVYGAERSSVAAITKDVASLALQGDSVAIGILERASEHLAELISRSDEIIGQAGLPIIFSGGVASEIPMIFDRLKAHFGERITMGDMDIAVAASLLAQ